MLATPRHLLALGLLATACGGSRSPAPARAPTRPLYILPLGDSFTQGRKGDGQPDTVSCDAAVESYRYPLWKMLVDAGVDTQVDFVGSLVGGFEGDPPWPDYRGKRFDREHEGHWGW